MRKTRRGDNSQMIVEDEQLFPCVLHRLLAQVLYETSDRHGLVVLVECGHGERMAALVRKQHL